MRSEDDFLGRVRLGTRTGPELWGGWGGCRAAREGRKRGTGGKEDPEDSAPECPHPARPRLGSRKRGFGSSLRRWPTRLPARTAVPP